MSNNSLTFINESGSRLIYSYDELNITLVLLHTSNLYSSSGSNNITFIRLNENNLLIMDMNYSFNKQLYDTYTISYSTENIYHLRFTNNYTSNELDLYNALSSIGYPYSLPSNELPDFLEMNFMKIYYKYIPPEFYTKLEVDRLILNLIDSAPSNLDTLNEIATFIQNEHTSVTQLITRVNTNINNISSLSNFITGNVIFNTDVRLSDARNVLNGAVNVTSLSSSFMLDKLKIIGLATDLSNINVTLSSKLNSNDIRLSDSRAPLMNSVTFTSLSSTFSIFESQVIGLVTDLSNINSSLSIKLNSSDSRLSDKRVPIDGSVTVTSLSSTFMLDKAKVTNLTTDLSNLGITLNSKVDTTDNRLVNTRIPTDGSVNVTSFSPLFLLDQSKVNGLVTDLSNINKAITLNVSTNDSRLTDNRTPLDASVTVTSLSSAFSLDKTKVTGLVTDLNNINTTLNSKLTSTALANITTGSLLCSNFRCDSVSNAIATIQSRGYAQLYLSDAANGNTCELWSGGGANIGLNIRTYQNNPITFSCAFSQLVLALYSDQRAEFEGNVIVKGSLSVAQGMVKTAATFHLPSNYLVLGTNSKITWNTIRNATGSAFSLSNGTVKVPVSGTYLITVQLSINIGAGSTPQRGNWVMQLNKNGTIFSVMYGLTTSVSYPFAANDTIEVGILSGDPSPVVNTNSIFTVTLL